MEQIKRLEEIAGKDCECTDDQQKGRDPLVCNSCYASRVLNIIYEEARNELEFLSGEKK